MIDALTKKLLWAKEYKSGDVTGVAGNVAGMADDIEAQVKRYEWGVCRGRRDCRTGEAIAECML